MSKERPIRVQLSRKKGWRIPANTVVVSRPSKWGNPYRIGGFVPEYGTLQSTLDAVAAYRRYIESALCKETPSGSALRLEMEINLEGKNLACWCPIGSPCHADVLLELANPTANKPVDAL